MTEMMKLETAYGCHDLCIESGTYAFGGGLFLQLYEMSEYGDIEPFANLTVNLPGFPESGNLAFINANNFPEAEVLISKYKLGVPTGEVRHSGFCSYPEYRFDIEELKKYCINPFDLDDRMAVKKERNLER